MKPVLTGLLIALFSFYLVVSENGLLDLYRMKKRISNIKEEIALLQEEETDLRKTIERYKSDPFVIERDAREKLGLVKPEERIYRDIDSK